MLVARCLCLCLLLLSCLVRMTSQQEGVLEDLRTFETNMNRGLELANSAQWRQAAEYFDLVLRRYNPASADAVHMLGLCSLNLGAIESAITSMERALRMSASHKDDILLSNYVEALQRGGRPGDAEAIAMQGLSLFPKSYRIRYNLASMFALSDQLGDAIRIFREMVNEPEHSTNPSLWQKLLDALNSAQLWSDLEMEGTRAIAIATERGVMTEATTSFHYIVGGALHQQQRIPEALQHYLLVLEADPTMYETLSNTAAAYQVLGDNDKAKEYYKRCLPFREQDSGIRNNYGSLLLVSGDDTETGLALLREALALSPNLESAVINMMAYSQDDLLKAESVELVERLLLITNGSQEVQLRRALLQFPVKRSYAEMLQERAENEESLDQYIAMRKAALLNRDDRELMLHLPDKIPFYTPYLGLNDRPFQERVAQAYRLMALDFANTLPPPRVQARGAALDKLYARARSARVRVGFMSKFFGLFEPHGLLLQGVMKFLSRSHFEVVLLAVPRSDMKPVDPSLIRAVDEVHETSLVPSLCADLVASLDLDVLVFADVLSEPINHYTSFLRLAPLQVAFWGNPITSGTETVDYFVSADCLEHPYRTRMPYSDEPYTEQVVLLGGQGIWYDRFPDSAYEYLLSINFTGVAPPTSWSRGDFGLEDDWFVFFCPQSVFKMHPLFDTVMRSIAALGEHVHVVVTGGRRKAWTDAYVTRLQTAFGPALAERLHVIERVSSERFIDLLHISDALLHPFPFDGSRTSADGLFAGLPVLMLPSEQLRGRMGAAFYRTMNMPEMVARNVGEYLSIAKRLCTDKAFYLSVKSSIAEKSHLIWEDLEYPWEWTQFLLKATGQPPLPWSAFIAQTGRDAAKEEYLLQVRSENRRAFDAAFGPEGWLLQGGAARLESRLMPGEVPRMFNDWKNPALDPTSPAPQLAAERVNAGDSYSLINDVSYNQSQVRSQLSSCVKRGFLDDCLNLAMGIYSSNSANPHFLLDLGMIQYFRGEYTEASRLCAKAADILPASAMAFACVGVAYTYQGEASRALAAMGRSWKLQLDHASTNGSPQVHSDIFNLPPGAIETNYLNALLTFKKYQECVDVVTLMASLPPLTKGGNTILTMAFVDWAPRYESAIALYEQELLLRGELHLPVGRSLLGEVRRVQREFPLLLDLALVCFNAALDMTDLRLKDGIYKRIHSMMGGFNEYPLEMGADLDGIAGPRSIYRNGGITLITQYFIAQEGMPRKQRDINDALQANLLNSAITQVVLLNEHMFNYTALKNNHKIKEVLLGSRLRFSDAFAYANEYLQGQTVIVANADIYFDGTMHKLAMSRARALNNTVLALLRFRDREPNIELSFRTDSQDAWIFHPPLNASLQAHTGFYLGAPRCDNRLAELLSTNGHSVVNPPFLLHAIELDNAKNDPSWDEGRVMYATNGSVLGGGRHLLIDTRLDLPIL